MTEKDIFLAARAKPQAERSAFLDAACAGDPELRRCVEQLLAAQGPDSSDATRTAAANNPPEPAPDQTETEPDSLAFLERLEAPYSLGRLNHCEVLEVIGRGGMGIVLKARDTRLQRIVAVKMLAPQLAASATARKRFAREARSAAAVRDEHVVDIHAVHEEGALPYLVTELVAGITLDERLKQGGTLDVKEVLRIGTQAAKGLAAAHARGLIHRDVKPGNILLEGPSPQPPPRSGEGS